MKSIGNPKIGDFVWIGNGAIIVDNILIGNNILIAANLYMNFDVPKDSIVLGNSAIIYPSKNVTEKYISNIGDGRKKWI